MQHRNFQLFIAGQLVAGRDMDGDDRAAVAGVSPDQFGGVAWRIWIRAADSDFAAGIGGGYVGDRFDRHKGVIWTQFASMILAFVLAGLTLTHPIRVWQLIVIALLVGVVNAFDVPIRQAFLVQMVGKEDLPNAIALNSSMFNGARALGPALGGIAIASIHEGWCFFINGVEFFGGDSGAAGDADSENRNKKANWFAASIVSPRISFLDERLADPIGVAAIERAQFVWIAVFGVCAGVCRAGAASRGARVGILMSAAGVGAVLGALHFAARTHYKGLARWVAAMSLTASVCLIAFSVSTVFWISILLLVVIGFAGTSQMAATNTTVQNRVPDELRSRVMAVYATMFMGVQPLGSLLAGGVAKRFGAPRALEMFGFVVLAASLVFLVRVAMRVPSGGAGEAPAG